MGAHSFASLALQRGYSFSYVLRGVTGRYPPAFRCSAPDILLIKGLQSSMSDGALRACRRFGAPGTVRVPRPPGCGFTLAPQGAGAAAVAGLATLLLLLTGAARPLHAQLGAVEALLDRVTDVSFYVSSGSLSPGTEGVGTGGYGLASYGLELLFSIGSVSRPVPGAEAPAGDTVAMEWVRTTLTRRGAYTDTTDVFEVRTVPREVPSETVWLFELGLGYGQLVGFEADSREVELKGTIRDLPSVSFYASYEPLGGYFGFRSGFMTLHALQFYDAEGTVYSGEAESFLASGLVGYAKEVLGFNLFAEGGYSLRYFPSVVWSTDALPPEVPRTLNLSGWHISGGIQFRLNQ